MIPAEAVEAAMRAFDPSWDTVPTEWRDYFLRRTRAALEAAAPHMVEQITTRVEQVNLPNGSVVITAKGAILQHFNGYWFAPGSSYRHHLDEVELPATVLHKATK